MGAGHRTYGPSRGLLRGVRRAATVHPDGRAGNFLIAAGAFPPDHPMPVSNPASQTLAKLVGLPARTHCSAA